MKCPICGKEINNSSNFCKYCGNPVILGANYSENNKTDDSRNKDFVHGDSDNTVTLTDEKGREIIFELLDLIPYRNQEYVVLLPQTEGCDEVVILQCESINDYEESYIGIDNEYTLNAVFELFKERKKDFFDFAD